LKQSTRAWLISVAPNLYWKYRKWRKGDEEPELALLPVLCVGGTAIDVGANYGMYLARLVELSQRCVAFEPIPAFADMLRRGFGGTVDVHAVALSEQSGDTVELRLPHLFTGYATVEKANELESRRHGRVDTIVVQRRCLDDYVFEGVAFIKIDVEGHEGSVLQGAVDTLRRCRPNVLVEVEERHNPGCIGRVLSLLHDLDYATFVLTGGSLREVPDLDLLEHQRVEPPDRYARNLICVPSERRDATVAAVAATLPGSAGSFAAGC
jgi:FkbM family methyltransferase